MAKKLLDSLKSGESIWSLCKLIVATQVFGWSFSTVGGLLSGVFIKMEGVEWTIAVLVAFTVFAVILFFIHHIKSVPSKPKTQPKVEDIADKPTSESVSKEELPKGIGFTNEQMQQTLGLLQIERNTALHWEFKYLQIFLIDETKNVLGWFAQQYAATPMNTYHTSYLPYINDVARRQRIIDALLAHLLLQSMDNNLQISQKGRDFLKWCGLTYQ